MSLVGLVIVLIVIGVLLWLVTTYIPLEPNIKKLIVAVVIIVTVLWLLSQFGVLDSINAVHIGGRHR